MEPENERIRAGIKKFDPETIDLCKSLIEDQYSQEWQKIAVNEAGPAFLTKEAYGKLWHPIRQMLCKQNITHNLIDFTSLIIGVRSELRKRLGILSPEL
jgi:hypothetical protein